MRTGEESEVVEDDPQKIRRQFRRDVAEGLASKRKHIPSKHLYDEQGSALFQKIMDLPQYYLFNAELNVLKENAENIAKAVSKQPFNLVELGAGDGKKTRILLDALRKEGASFEFMIVDISRKAVNQFMDSMREHDVDVEFKAVVADYVHGLKQIRQNSTRRNLILFLGSNVGNFPEGEDVKFLRQVRKSVKKGDLLLVGFDLTSDPEKLKNAYDDGGGVTARFNMNLLERLNRELGADFDMRGFRHLPVYNEEDNRMESYIESLREQVVSIENMGLKVRFEKGERIHVEVSKKYASEEVEEIAAESGFKVLKNHYSTEKDFTDSLWEAV